MFHFALLVDSLTFVLPEAFQMETLPSPVCLQIDFGFFEVTYTHEDDTPTYVRRFLISGREIPAGAYTGLQRFYQDVIKADKTQVVLKRRPTAQQYYP